MKTVVQLIKEAHDDDEIDFYDWFTNHQQELLDKEKEQIIEAHKEGFLSNDSSGDYYTKTYNQ